MTGPSSRLAGVRTARRRAPPLLCKSPWPDWARRPLVRHHAEDGTLPLFGPELVPRRSSWARPAHATLLHPLTSCPHRPDRAENRQGPVSRHIVKKPGHNGRQAVREPTHRTPQTLRPTPQRFQEQVRRVGARLQPCRHSHDVTGKMFKQLRRQHTPLIRWTGQSCTRQNHGR